MKMNWLPRFLSGVAVAGVWLAAPTFANAQSASEGYWNLETNLNTRSYTLVRFYNAQHQLVYEEHLPTLCIDLSRGTGLCRRTARQLDMALQRVLQNSGATAQPATMLAAQFSQNRRMQRVYAVR